MNTQSQKYFIGFTKEQVENIDKWLEENHKGHYSLKSYIQSAEEYRLWFGGDHTKIEIVDYRSKSGLDEFLKIDLINENFNEIEE